MCICVCVFTGTFKCVILFVYRDVSSQGCLFVFIFEALRAYVRVFMRVCLTLFTRARDFNSTRDAVSVFLETLMDV